MNDAKVNDLFTRSSLRTRLLVPILTLVILSTVAVGNSFKIEA